MAQESSVNLSGSTGSGTEPVQVRQNKAFSYVEDKPVALFLLLLNAVFTASGIYVRSGSMPDGSCSLTADNPVLANFSGSNVDSHPKLIAIYVLPMVFFTITVFTTVLWDVTFKIHHERIRTYLYKYVAVPMDKYCKEKSMLAIMVVALCFLASAGLLLPFIVVIFLITLLIVWFGGICNKKCHTFDIHAKTLCECLLSALKYFVIWVAGTLYLAGDNLLLIAKEVDGELEVSGFPARELRSYIVSFALLVYILKDQGIIFIDEHRKNFSNEDIDGLLKISEEPPLKKTKKLSQQQALCLVVVQVLKQWCQLLAVAVPIDGVFTTIKDTITPNIQDNGLCVHNSSQIVNISAVQCKAADDTTGYFAALVAIWFSLATVFLAYTYVKLYHLCEKDDEVPTACFLTIAVVIIYSFIIFCIPAFVATDNSFPWVVYALKNILGDSNSLCRLAQKRIAILSIVAVVANFFLNVVVTLAVLEHAILACKYVQIKKHRQRRQVTGTTQYSKL